MKLYVDLESRELIECPGFRNPVTTLRFKRGDSAKLEVAFLTNGSTHAAIGDPDALTMRFGVKPSNRFDLDYLVYCDEWTMPAEEEPSPVYVCYPSFNTVELDAALDVGEEPELASVTLMGEITWSEGDGEPTSTRTFIVIVENDVIRGGETEPTSANIRAPFDVGDVATDLVPVDYADGANQKLALTGTGHADRTIVPAVAGEGAILTLYIVNNDEETRTLDFDATIPSDTLLVLPKTLDVGLYRAQLCCLPVLGWGLTSLDGAFQAPPVIGPPLWFKGGTDNKWTTPGNWFTNEAGTTPADAVPWIADNIYKNSNLAFATNNTAQYVETGSYDDPVTLLFGFGFTITGTASMEVQLKYCVVTNGTFLDVSAIDHCTIIDGTFNHTGMTFYTSTVNGGVFDMIEGVMFYGSTWNDGTVIAHSQYGFFSSMGSVINGGYWDNHAYSPCPYPWDEQTQQGFHDLYPA